MLHLDWKCQYKNISLKRPRNSNNTVAMTPLRTQMAVSKTNATWKNSRFLVWSLCYSRKQVNKCENNGRHIKVT